MLGFSSNKQLLPTQEVTITCSTQARLPVVRRAIEEEMSYLDVTGSTQKGTIVALLEWGQFNRIAKTWRIPLEQIKVAPESKKLGSVAIYQLAFLFWRAVQSSSKIDVLFRYSDSPMVSALIQTAHLFNVHVVLEEGKWGKHILGHVGEIIETKEIDEREFKHSIDFSGNGKGSIENIHISSPRSIWKWYHRAQKTVTVGWKPQDLDLILYLLQQESIEPIFPEESQWKVVSPEKKKKTAKKTSKKVANQEVTSKSKPEADSLKVARKKDTSKKQTPATEKKKESSKKAQPAKKKAQQSKSGKKTATKKKKKKS